MKVFNHLNEWRDQRAAWESDRLSVGLVATMGALHEGHLSLVHRSLAETDRTVVTIFVNPTQFNDARDLASYHRDLDGDCAKLKNAGVHAVLVPSYEDMYPDEYRYRVSESDFSSLMEGKYRPGHFDGVLTVVLKLLNVIRPDRSYFGEKDFQQYELIRDMAEAFFLETEIVACPTVREAEGLAKSSRNLLLSSEDRQTAAQFYRELSSNKPLQIIRDVLGRRGFEVDYIEEHGGRRFGAVRLGDVRLIDNVKI